MKVLLTSLAISNRGDEAIGRAIVSALINTGAVDELTILYCEPITSKNIITVSTKYSRIKINHNSPKNHTFWERKIIYLTFLLPFTISRLLIKASSLAEDLDLIVNSDRVINAPGGVDIGPYKSWRMLWQLFVAQKLKPTSFYARSYGPLPAADSIRNFLFQKIAKKTLRKINFVSLRDTGSQKYAKLDNIPFKPTIDCVFLDKHTASLNAPRIKETEHNSEYVIFSLNELCKWHPWYGKIENNLLDKLYIEIISFFTTKQIKVFLLPHLYACKNDKRYCESIASLCKKTSLIECLPDTYDSYTQQYIIRNASFLVSARFHPTVFAIKNGTPFLSLSYEHKMIETLRMLSLEDFSINLQSYFQSETSPYENQKELTQKLEHLFQNKAYNKKSILKANDKAFNIASSTFNDFTKNFLRN